MFTVGQRFKYVYRRPWVKRPTGETVVMTGNLEIRVTDLSGAPFGAFSYVIDRVTSLDNAPPDLPTPGVGDKGGMSFDFADELLEGKRPQFGKLTAL
jgi:hypothetical protein